MCVSKKATKLDAKKQRFKRKCKLVKNHGSNFEDQGSAGSNRRCMEVTQTVWKLKRVTVVVRQCYGGVIDELPW